MKRGRRQLLCSALMAVVCLAWASSAQAKTAEELTIALDTIWVLVTASLVFFMNLGFALVESGFCRAKNTVNILSKNFIVFAISCLAFYVFGWGLMFGNGSGLRRASRGCSRSAAPTTVRPPATPIRAPTRRLPGPACRSTPSSSSSSCSPARPRRSSRARWPSGSSTSRSSCSRSCWWRSSIRSPVTGSGAAAGWRSAGFWDFAGSTVVHSVGGWAALAGILVLGPRLGKYGAGRQGPPDSRRTA